MIRKCAQARCYDQSFYFLSCHLLPSFAAHTHGWLIFGQLCGTAIALCAAFSRLGSKLHTNTAWAGFAMAHEGSRTTR